MREVRSSRFRRVVQGSLASALAIVGLVAFGTPAVAHDNIVSAQGSCASPLGTGYVVTWTIQNDYNLTETGSITSVTEGASALPLATLDSSTYSIGASPSQPYATATITQTLPAGTVQGTLTLNISSKWSDGYPNTDAGTYDLSALHCAAPVQNIAGHLYLCSAGSPTTTEETGGTLAANGPSTVPSTSNPLAPTDVGSGSFTMTATPPSGYYLVACGGSSSPNAGGTSATESVSVASDGAGAGVFYVVKVAPSISILKTSPTPSYAAVGDTVDYNFLVTNTGNVTLSAIAVNDVQTTPATQANLSAIACPDATLAPAASETCIATYTVTQADLNAGAVNDSATASGTPPGSQSPVTSGPSSATVPAVDSPSISILKTSPTPSFAAVGDTVVYNFLVTNTGNVTLSAITVNDVQSAPASQSNLSAITCPEATLAPAVSETCTATYTVTQADLNAGLVNDSAITSGTPPGAQKPVTSVPSTASVPDASIAILKTSPTPSYAAVGDTVDYNFLVTNTGAVTLSGITVNDVQSAPANQGNLSAITCPDATLAPAASETCTATYTVAQPDLNAGSVNDSATASGIPPGAEVPITSRPSSTSVPVASITILKQVCGSEVAVACGAGSVGPWTSSAVVPAGDTAYWRITVTNTGGIALDGVSIGDSVVAACATPASTGSLGVGASLAIYCSSPDVTSGIVNVATARYSGQNGPPPSSSAQVAVLKVIPPLTSPSTTSPVTSPNTTAPVTSPAVSASVAPAVTG